MRLRLRTLVYRLALSTASMTLVLLGAELLIRLVAPQQLIQLRPDVWIADDGLGWRHAPGLDVKINTGEREIRLMTDDRGHRIGPERVSSPVWWALALGDSFLEAIQVEHEDSFADLLERRLSAAVGAPGRLVNAGVGGWDPNHYLLEARRELPRRRYRGLVVFLYLGNDAVDRRRDHLSPRQPAQRHRLRLPTAATRAEWIDAVAFPVNDALETRSHLFILAKNRGKHLLMRLGLSRHGVPESIRRSAASSPRWSVTADIAAELAAEAGRYGLSPLFVFLPGLYQVDPDTTRRYLESLSIDPATVDTELPAGRLREAFVARGLTPLDVTPQLQEAHRAGGDALFGRVDSHLTPRGHRVVAEAVAPILLERLREAG